MFPLIPILCAVAILGGVGCMAWYDSLSKEEKEKADRMANELAWKLYQKSLKNLTRDQFDHIAETIRKRMIA